MTSLTVAVHLTRTPRRATPARARMLARRAHVLAVCGQWLAGGIGVTLLCVLAPTVEHWGGR